MTHDCSNLWTRHISVTKNLCLVYGELSHLIASIYCGRYAVQILWGTSGVIYLTCLAFCGLWGLIMRKFEATSKDYLLRPYVHPSVCQCVLLSVRPSVLSSVSYESWDRWLPIALWFYEYPFIYDLIKVYVVPLRYEVTGTWTDTITSRKSLNLSSLQVIYIY